MWTDRQGTVPQIPLVVLLWTHLYLGEIGRGVFWPSCGLSPPCRFQWECLPDNNKTKQNTQNKLESTWSFSSSPATRQTWRMHSSAFCQQPETRKGLRQIRGSPYSTLHHEANAIFVAPHKFLPYIYIQMVHTDNGLAILSDMTVVPHHPKTRSGRSCEITTNVRRRDSAYWRVETTHQAVLYYKESERKGSQKIAVRSSGWTLCMMFFAPTSFRQWPPSNSVFPWDIARKVVKIQSPATKKIIFHRPLISVSSQLQLWEQS